MWQLGFSVRVSNMRRTCGKMSTESIAVTSMVSEPEALAVAGQWLAVQTLRLHSYDVRGFEKYWSRLLDLGLNPGSDL